MADQIIKIPKQNKLELYKLLLKEIGTIFEDERERIIPFLNAVCDLSFMKSEDSRYNNAYGDFVQHLVNNDDYSYDYVFKERLDLLNNDERFNNFIEAIVAPQFRNGEDDIFKYVLLISTYLEKDSIIFTLKEYNDIGEPIFKLTPKTNDSRPFDIKVNDIIFYVEKNPKGREYWASSHSKPETYPSFVLALNNGWNDYSTFSSFYLYYYSAAGEEPTHLGTTKIIYYEDSKPDEHIPDQFTVLPDSFCSLGQRRSYYRTLKELFGNKRIYDILYALKDAAFFPEIQEKFERHTDYSFSLIRTDDAERLVREARYITFDYDLSNLYSFKYLFQPKYSDEQIEIDFEFNNNQPIANRIYALIGKNGTGKTQLITSLPLDISQNKNDYFIPRTPLFSKIIAVSYSVFDNFEIPQKTSTFNYHYCGVKKLNDDNLIEKRTDRGLVLKFHNSWKKIEKLGRINKWRKILLTFIEEEMLDTFLVKIQKDEITSSKNDYKVVIDGFNDVKNKFSSGQAILLYIISEIVANIRYDSLLLCDEPETHLHPNAITQLMNTIHELVEEFQSYCIIATHSPLLIRELLSRNVYIIDRNGNTSSVRRISSESFGENLSVLTEEIFGNKGIPKLHTKILKKLVDSGDSFDEIVSLLEYDQMPLSLNARIFISSLIHERDGEVLS